MHGVRLVSTPPAKTERKRPSGFPERSGRKDASRSTGDESYGERKVPDTAALGARRLLTASQGAAQGHVHPGGAAAGTGDTSQMSDMADHAMDGHAGSMDDNMMKHMALTPSRPATPADSARARQIATDLKRAIAKYDDTTAAVADGYKMFAPNVKNQHVFHFTNRRARLQGSLSLRSPAADVDCCTSATPTESSSSSARCTPCRSAPSPDKLDERVPLAIAHWHRARELVSSRNSASSTRLAERDSDGQPGSGRSRPSPRRRPATRSEASSTKRRSAGWST